MSVHIAHKIIMVLELFSTGSQIIGHSSVAMFSWMLILCKYAERNHYFLPYNLKLNSFKLYSKMSTRKVNFNNHNWSFKCTSNAVLYFVSYSSSKRAIQSASSSYCTDSWNLFWVFSLPLSPSQFQTPNTIAVWLSACLTLWIWPAA